jgi:GNAT superfamily N-acetyltransferase
LSGQRRDADAHDFNAEGPTADTHIALARPGQRAGMSPDKLSGGNYRAPVGDPPGQPIRVRVASEADLPAVKMLRDAFYSESSPSPWRDESWETHADEIVQVVRGGGALLAEHLEETVGFALAWSEGLKAVKLGDLYVRPQHRGKGIGRALVRAVAELARLRGAGYVHLTANLEALTFYDQLAFSEESRNLFGSVERLLPQ